MARRCSISSATATVFLVLGLFLSTTFSDAAAILRPNRTPVKLYSSLTGRCVAVLANGTIHANRNCEDRSGDTNLIMEYVGSQRRFRRQDLSIYITVTPEGDLKALAEGSTTGSTHFLPIVSVVNGQLRYKLQTTVQYQSAADILSQTATCYVAIDDPVRGEPPCNVCAVPGNDFTFDDEDTLLFAIELSSNAFGR